MTKASPFLLMLALSAASVANAEDGLKENGLSIFEVGNRLSGLTYEESFDLHMTSSFEVFGETQEMVMHMQMESDTDVQDLPQGGQQVHTTVLHLEYDTAMSGFEISCDTQVPRADSEPNCDPFYDLLTDMTFVVDDRGHIAEDDSTEEGVSNAALTQDQQGSPSQQLQTAARLLEFVPSHPVELRESWDSSTELVGLGYFEGTSELLEFDGEEDGVPPCAVISTVGTLTIDMKELSKSMGGQLAALQDADMSITDARMAAKMCWDDKSKMARWSTTDMSLIMHMKNPLDDSELDMPVQEIIKTTCKVKET